MERREELRELFHKLGLHPDNEALDICVEVCERQNLGNATFIDAWVAFSVSVLNASVPPTADKLIIFEKKEFGDPIFSTPKRAVNKITKKEINYVSPIPGSSNKRRIDEVIDSPKQSAINAFSQVFSMNNTNTKCSPRLAPARTNTLEMVEPRTSFPPPGSSSVEFFSSLDPLKKYGYFSNNVPCKFEPTIKLFGSEAKKTWKCMVDSCIDSWNRIQDFIEEIASIIVERNNLPDPIPFNDLPAESKVYVGRIVQETGRINSTDLCILGLGQNAKTFVTLDISDIENYSVFPGQVIAFRGVSREEKKLIATELYTSAKGPTPEPPIIKEPFSIMVAAGPFAPVQSCDPIILNRLINHAKAIQPAFLIIVGPFLDCPSEKHTEIDMKSFSSKNLIDLHNMMLKKFTEAFAGLKTKVYFITSSNDITALPVFPTPVPDTGDNSHFPDPSLLDINGLIFGVTSADIIFYLSQQEYSSFKPGNRLDRLTQHLLNQQTFYPIETGPPDGKALDYTSIFLRARLPVVPHILILPSELQSYIKEIDGCVMINPQKCDFKRLGNNFSLIEVRGRRDSEEWTPSTHISVKIIRI